MSLKQVVLHRHYCTKALGVLKKYVLVDYFKGEPKPSDLKIVEEELRPIKDGEFLAQAEYLSVDPYMRSYITQYPKGITMIGSQVAKIIDSKNADYPVGKRIVGYMGWRSHTIMSSGVFDGPGIMKQVPYVIPDLGDLPVSLALGALGMPGNTAYFGLLEICHPKPGETLIVTGAAGAVGCHVGQIGKMMGMRVIGVAGSDEKCRWLAEDLGFDAAINYKAGDFRKELRKVAADGIDCFFDNVGGEMASIITYQMKEHGRISVCGSISSYNTDGKGLAALPKATILQPALVTNKLTVRGFRIIDWADRTMEAINQNLQWIKEGKLRYRETVTEGFENTFAAFTGMLKGENVGKAIVKV